MIESIVLGGGCFWCTEAAFVRLRGVKAVESGYAGGHVANPTYEQVCTGSTGHAEVVKVGFDPVQIDVRDILRVFFTVHDPTTLNRQGADQGTQYRSCILFEDDGQKAASAEVMKEVADGKWWSAPIVTELARLETFWPAEADHRAYYERNRNQPYCQVVIDPKIAKLRAKFSKLLADPAA